MEFLAQFHPIVVHFPIAFFLGYVLFEIIGAFTKKDFFSKTAHLLLFLGVLGALVAVLTGSQAEDVAQSWQKAGNIFPAKALSAIGEHADSATLTLWYFFALLVLRTYFVLKKKFTKGIKYIFIVLALVGSFFVYRTGKLGGNLVYKYGIGTEFKKMEINK
ncbi:MAG TPA: DUF2231 domain-containing protein [Ignavibacteria bacterium]|nr:DUF2231 domain-containing protein [Ignavibacteria bacterium]